MTSSSDSATRPHQRLAHLFARWAWAAAVLSLIAGLIIGWIFGSWAACGAACKFDVALFEAIGTWMGGVVVAAIAGVYGVYSARRNRRLDREEKERTERVEREREERKRRDDALDAARLCALRFRAMRGPNSGFGRVHIEFANKLLEPVTAVKLRGVDGSVFREDDIVAPGRSWGTNVLLSDLGIAEYFDDEGLAQQALNREGVQERIVFEFTLRGFRFRRRGTVTTPAE